MRRADRLFRIITLLQGRHTAITAQALGDVLEVSARTVYRDIADLSSSGVPVEGEAGIGYRLDDSYHLPPLMLTPQEAEAAAFGAEVASYWGPQDLRDAAMSLKGKLAAALPPDLRALITANPLLAQHADEHPEVRVDAAALRKAVRERCKVSFDYKDVEGRGTTRTVRPLAVMFFGPVWLLAAWCESRSDFRVFRLDRMESLATLLDRFTSEAGRTLEDFLSSEWVCTGNHKPQDR